MTGLVRNELVRSSDVSNRIVTLTAATTLTVAKHEGRILLLSLLAGFDTTLPPATGSGAIYHFKVGIVRTGGDYGILVTTTDIMQGSIIMDGDESNDVTTSFGTASDSDSFTMNATTTGGLSIGDWVEFVDILSGTWSVTGIVTESGNEATPFSADIS